MLIDVTRGAYKARTQKLLTEEFRKYSIIIHKCGSLSLGVFIIKIELINKNSVYLKWVRKLIDR